jgi:hypothetical protein
MALGRVVASNLVFHVAGVASIRCKLHKLTLFRWLNSKGIKGNIPSSLGDLDLSVLDLSNNFLNGSIPSSLGHLSEISIINLNNNHLSGSIPTSLGELSFLKSLDLSSNRLTGEIPSSLGTIFWGLSPPASLGLLNLANNQLSGEIPSSLGDLTSLLTLDLSFNQLSGEIPSSLGRTELLHLRLQNNQLRGLIPSSLGSLVILRTLDLSSNLLGGLIPSSLVSLTNLQDLLIKNNSLTGPVPELSSSIIRCELSNNTDICGHPDINNICTDGLITCNMDCRMMNSWLPTMFDRKTCCSQSGIGCIDERITNFYVYFKNLLCLELWVPLDSMARYLN